MARPGRTLLDTIRDERLDTWLDLRRTPTRRRLLEPLVDAVRSPAEMPDGVDDPIQPLRWLLGELAEGQPLTQTGNLGRAFVQDAAERFGWWDTGLHGLPRSEDELYDLHQVRHLAQRLGLARRSGRKLVLTAKARSARNNGDHLWRTAARGLLSTQAFAAALGELSLALLASRETALATEIDAVLSAVAREVGWRTVDTGVPPDANDIRWAWHETTNLLRALNLLSAGGDWRDRSYGLTPAGRAVALECLQHRATGPRSSPYG